MYKPILVSGGFLPLRMVLQLRSLEVELVFARLLVIQYDKRQRLREQLIKRVGTPVAGLSQQEATALLQQQVAEQEQWLVAWSYQRERAADLVREGLRLGYL